MVFIFNVFRFESSWNARKLQPLKLIHSNGIHYTVYGIEYTLSELNSMAVLTKPTCSVHLKWTHKYWEFPKSSNKSRYFIDYVLLSIFYVCCTYSTILGTLNISRKTIYRHIPDYFQRGLFSMVLKIIVASVSVCDRYQSKFDRILKFWKF